MPTVPYPQRQVGPSALPDVRVSPNAPSAAFGGAVDTAINLSGVQKQAQQIQDDERFKADQINVNAADAQLYATVASVRQNAMSLKGKDAMGGLAQAQQDWQKATATIQSGLTSDRQREAFTQRATQHWGTLVETIENHARVEVGRFDDETTQGVISGAQNDALQNYGDPGRVQQSIDKQTAALQDWGQRKGIAPELVQSKIADTVSTTQSGVISQMLTTGQNLTAKAYFDAHKTDLVGSDLLRSEAAVNEGSTRAASQQQATTIMASATSLTDALTQARTVADPSVQDATVQRVKEMWGERQQVQTQQHAQQMTALGNLLDRQGTVRAIDPTTWSSLSIGDKETLRGYAGALAKEAAGTPVVTDLTKWTDLRDMAANPATRAAFLAQNPLSWRGSLDTSDYKEMVGVREGLLNKDTATATKLDALNFRTGVITQSLHGINVGVSAKARATDEPIIAAVHRAVDTQVEQFQEQAKRPVTAKEVQQITDAVITSHIVADPHWYNSMGLGSSTTTKRTFQLQPTDVLSPSDIKPNDRAAIAAQLRAKGLPVTDQSIFSAYSSYVQGLARSGRGPQ